jgi:hypothetical protein
MELPIIYSDELVDVFADGIRFKTYYFPLGQAKFILFSQVRSWEQRPSTLWNGKWRLWGTGDFQTWFPLDWLRPGRDAIFFLTLTTQPTRIGFTVENSDKFLAVLKSKVPVKF